MAEANRALYFGDNELLVLRKALYQFIQQERDNTTAKSLYVEFGKEVTRRVLESEHERVRQSFGG